MRNARKPAASERTLPPDVEQALAEAIGPLAPPPDRAAILRTRVLERVRPPSQRFVTVRTTDGAWIPIAPKIAVRMLDDDGEMQAFLLRLDPGGCLPAHEHVEEESCLVLEGSVRIGDTQVHAGDYHIAPAGSAHGELVSDGGALLFLRTRSGTIPHPPMR